MSHPAPPALVLGKVTAMSGWARSSLETGPAAGGQVLKLVYEL